MVPTTMMRLDSHVTSGLVARTCSNRSVPKSLPSFPFLLFGLFCSIDGSLLFGVSFWREYMEGMLDLSFLFLNGPWALNLAH